MNEPWFDASVWGWLPGTLYGCLAGAWGSLAGFLAPKGKARSFILGSGAAFLVAAIVFFAAGVTAIATGQPYGVRHSLLLPGVLGLIIFPLNLPNLRNRYREAEQRRMHAADFG